MTKLMKFVALTAVLCCFLPTMITADSKWGEEQYCPDGEVALAFGMKQGNRGFSSISLRCSGGKWISSSDGSWFSSPEGPPGKWRKNSLCPENYVLASCMLKIFDDEFVNNMTCFCLNSLNNRQTEFLEGDGFWNGKLGDITDFCDKGINGLKTRVQKDEEAEEDNAVITDIKFLCRDS